MPAFTAIGAYVAGTLIGLTAGTVAFVAVSSIVAIGAAYITSRVINGNPNKGSLDSGSQGGRIQIPPATNNKIPVVYGSAFVNGIITDAWLTTTDQKKNDVMYYCLVLSETCNIAGAAYSIDDIYWGDLRLTFETSGGNQHKVLDGRKTVDGPGEDFINADFKVDGTNHVEVRVYAGNSTSAKQIFPLQSTSNTANAYDYWPDSQWTSTNQMEGLVFAIIKLKYNAEKGFTNLPAVTFKLTNNKSNPAEVWRDYMTSDRYGAGIGAASIPTTAGLAYDKWYNYCNELIRYTDKDSVSTTQKRYEINGVIDTSNSVKSNIDSLMQNGGAWLSYDVATGYWNPIIKKAVSAGEPSISATHFTGSIAGTTLTVTVFPEGRIEAGQELYNTAGTYIGTIVSQTLPLTTGESTGQKGRYTISATGTGTTFYTKAAGLLSFDDDNILTGISISSTRLDDLYNKYEIEFFDKYNRDQRAYARDELAAGDRNPTEPDNQLRLGLEFTNNSVQANLLGNIELRQSRDDLVIEFTASHYGIQTQAGDVIEVTNDIYGWAPKLFRVMRVKEIETEEGGLVAEISALEYNGDVYTVEALTEFTTETNIGIPPTKAGGTSGNIKTPDDDRVSVVEVNNTAAVPYIVMAVKIPTTGGPYEVIEIWYAEAPIGVTPGESAFTRLITHKPPPPETVFNNGRTITATSITGSNTLNTSTAHGLLAGQQLYFTSTTANGLTQNKAYWVLSAGLTTTAFRLSLTENGSAIALTNGTGLTLNFDTCHLIYITQLPANQTGQEYYFRVRVGGANYFSGFTDPDAASIATPQTPWNPFGGSGSGFDLSGAAEGDTIYYDATTGVWKKNSILTINDTTGVTTTTGDLVVGSTFGALIVGAGGVIKIQNTDPDASSNALYVQNRSSVGFASNGFGVGIGFEAENGSGNIVDIGNIFAAYSDVTDGSETSAMVLTALDAGGYLVVAQFSPTEAFIVGDIEYDGGDIRSTNVTTNFSHTSQDSHTFSIDDINTATGETKTVNIASNGQSGSDTVVNIGSSVSSAISTVNLYKDVNISGELNVTADVFANDLNANGNLSLNYNQTPGANAGVYAYSGALGTTLGSLEWDGANWTVSGALSSANLAIDNRVYFDSNTLTTSTTTANQTLHSFDKSLYRTCKYVISIESGTAYQAIEILVTHDGTTAYQTTYADIATGANLSTFNVTVSGSNVLLRTTPINAVTTYKFSLQLIVV